MEPRLALDGLFRMLSKISKFLNLMCNENPFTHRVNFIQNVEENIFVFCYIF